jgi:hypothetical protein
MDSDRREFLKAASMAGIGAGLGLGGLSFCHEPRMYAQIITLGQIDDTIHGSGVTGEVIYSKIVEEWEPTEEGFPMHDVYRHLKNEWLEGEVEDTTWAR